MADIFISYAREDVERVRVLADALAAEGWSVFWDRTIPFGMTWRQVIGKEIDEARCVIVAWSTAAIGSTWVHEEADDGGRRGILIPVLIEPVMPPIGFRSYQAADLSDWDGNTPTPVFERLIADIARLLGPPPAELEQARLRAETDRKAEEAEARRRADEEESRRRSEEEAKRKAEEEERKRAEEEAAREKAEEEVARGETIAAAKRKAEAKAEREAERTPARPRRASGKRIALAAVVVMAIAGIGTAVLWQSSTSDEESLTRQEQMAVEEEAKRKAEEVETRRSRIEAITAERFALSKLNVRAGPGTEHERLTTLARGSPVTVTGLAGDWYRVALTDDRSGFVFRELLGENPPADRQSVVGVPSGPFEPGETFQDCDVCPEMVVVPAGSFMMGSPPDERERQDDEGPVPYTVRIPRPFAMGKFEVTNAAFVAFLNTVGNKGTESEPWFETKEEDERSRIIVAGGGGYRVEAGYEIHPVLNVSWYGARAYVKWLSDKTGAKYRLSTEAEWEYAARAGTTTRYWWGDAFDVSRANSDRSGTTAVERYPANAFGLHDVHGNVWEWVADCYKKDAYSTHKNYPAMAGSWQDSCGRVLRGGSWFNLPRFLRSAYRSWGVAGYRSSYAGFRVARTL